MQGMQEALNKAGLEVKDFPSAPIEEEDTDIAVAADVESIPASVTHDNAPVVDKKQPREPRRQPDNRGDRRIKLDDGSKKPAGKPGFKSKPRGPFVTAMATVARGNRQGEIVFRGCFVAGTSIDGEARARVVAPNRDCPDWFIKECRAIADNFSDKQVRIRVSHTIGNGMAFANPAADSLEQLNEEWARQERDLQAFPTTLEECPGLATAVELIFKKAAEVFSTDRDRLELLKLVVRAPADGGSYAILGIKRNGMIYKFTQAEAVWEQRQQIADGLISLEQAIETSVIGTQIKKLTDLD